MINRQNEPQPKPQTNKTFPLTIHGRTFETEQEYLDAIHEFLNGQ